MLWPLLSSVSFLIPHKAWAQEPTPHSWKRPSSALPLGFYTRHFLFHHLARVLHMVRNFLSFSFQLRCHLPRKALHDYPPSHFLAITLFLTVHIAMWFDVVDLFISLFTFYSPPALKTLQSTWGKTPSILSALFPSMLSAHITVPGYIIQPPWLFVKQMKGPGLTVSR